MSTVQFIRRLPSYTLRTTENSVDPWVLEILNERLDRVTLDALDDYTRGMYSEELHYSSFLRYARPLSEDYSRGWAFTSDSLFKETVRLVRETLSNLDHIRPISHNMLDSVEWVSSSAAGYGYIGKKCDNYLLARRNATRALWDYERYGSLYRFVPDKAYARTQLSLRTSPKIRHVWGRPFHHILIEGTIANHF